MLSREERERLAEYERTRNELARLVTFDWVTLGGGAVALAVCAGGRVEVWHKVTPTDLFSFRPQWTKFVPPRRDGTEAEPKPKFNTITPSSSTSSLSSLSSMSGKLSRPSKQNQESINNEARVASFNGARAVCWTSAGQLIVACDEQLVVLTNWLDGNTLSYAIQSANAPLPFYHPKVLSEHLMAGRLDRVHAILRHLLYHIREDGDIPHPPLQRYTSTLLTTTQTQANSASTQTLKKSASSLTHSDSVKVEKFKTTSTETARALLDDDPYDNLDAFSLSLSDSDESADHNDTEEEETDDTSVAQTSTVSDAYMQQFDWSFETLSPAEAKELKERLAEITLRGLDETGQPFLIALIDAVTSLDRSWTDMLAVRFVLMVRYLQWMQRENKLPSDLKHFNANTSSTSMSFLSDSSSTSQENLMFGTPNHSMLSVAWCWAYHCHDQQPLLDLCLPPGDTTTHVWENVRRFGVPLWCTQCETLRQICDRLGTHIFSF